MKFVSSDNLARFLSKLKNVFVMLTGNQTIGGSKTFTKSVNAKFGIADSTGDAPASSQYNAGLILYDNAGNKIGFVEAYEDANGILGCAFSAIRKVNDTYKYNKITPRIDADGNFSYSIASPSAFRDALGLGNMATKTADDYVDTSSVQTIAGTKTFSNTINGSVSGNAGSATKLKDVAGGTVIDLKGFYAGVLTDNNRKITVFIPYPKKINGLTINANYKVVPRHVGGGYLYPMSGVATHDYNGCNYSNFSPNMTINYTFCENGFILDFIANTYWYKDDTNKGLNNTPVNVEFITLKITAT